MGCDSCGHLCRKSLHSQCRYTRQCSNWCWDRQMLEIQWPSWQLLSTSCNRNHWCVQQVHCPLLELSRKETRWHFRRSQRVTMAPTTPVSGCGQREHHQHIGLCASLIRFFHPQCINQCSCPYTSMYSHRLPNVCFLWTLLSSMFFYASWKASVQFCFAPLFSHPDQPHFVYFSCTQHYCITVYCKTFL